MFDIDRATVMNLVVIAIVLLVPCFWKTGARCSAGVAAIAGIWLLIQPAGRGPLAFLLLAFATMVGLGLRSELAASRRVLAGAVAAFLVIGLTAFSRHPAPRTPMADRFPLLSLAPRLEYEARAQVAEPKEPFTADVTAAMTEQDQRMAPWNERVAILRLFHAGVHRRFDETEGFGVSRMGELTPDKLVLPAEPDPLPTEPPDTLRYEPLAGPSDVPDVKRLQGAHVEARDSFLWPTAFGYVRDREHVAGFASHAFRRPLEPRVESPRGAVAWNLTRLQLVSLLKHETPRVYESGELPNMERLAAVPTRALTDFEQAALLQLVTERDVVTEDGPHRIQMLGSLRASKACQQCHEVPMGTLLGAFSYVFSRVPDERDVAVP
jgi:hypothetical protein